jgi:hypothetical protein
LADAQAKETTFNDVASAVAVIGTSDSAADLVTADSDLQIWIQSCGIREPTAEEYERKYLDQMDKFTLAARRDLGR